MKFGKQLRLAATPAWDDFYVNYKEAKQLLKRKLAKAEAAAEQNDPRALEEVVNKIRDVVAKCLKTEIVKYDNFCKKQILSVEKASRAITDEARDATVSLVRSLSSSRLPASNHEAAAAPELGAVVAAGGNSALAVKVEDGEVIKLKLLGENKAHHNVGGTVSAGTVLSAVNTPRASGDEAEDEPEVDEEEMAASAARHNQLVRLERRLSSLEKFFAINCTAITKLVKKYAKKFAKFNSSVAGVVEPILIKKQQAREADLAKVRSHVTLTLSDIPQAPMVQEGTLDVDDSSDFGVNTDVLNVDEIELKKLPVAAITNLSVVSRTLLDFVLRHLVFIARQGCLTALLLSKGRFHKWTRGEHTRTSHCRKGKVRWPCCRDYLCNSWQRAKWHSSCIPSGSGVGCRRNVRNFNCRPSAESAGISAVRQRLCDYQLPLCPERVCRATVINANLVMAKT